MQGSRHSIRPTSKDIKLKAHIGSCRKYGVVERRNVSVINPDDLVKLMGLWWCRMNRLYASRPERAICWTISISILFAVCHSSAFHHSCLTLIGIDPILYGF